MIVEIVTLTAIALIGIPIALLLDRDARGGLVYGLAILLGIGLVASVLFVESMIGIHWSRAAMMVPPLIIGAVAAFAARNERRRLRIEFAFRPLPAALDAVTVLGLAGYAVFATIAPPWEFDFIVDWGLKARNFWVASGVDWNFLQQTFGRAVHPDYPLLLPLTFDALALARGEWNDRALGLVNVAFAAALLLIVHRVALDDGATEAEASFLTLAILPFAVSPWIGLAEGPFVACTTAAALLIRRGSASLTAAAVLLGLAANTKNEGVAFIVAVAVGLAVAGRIRDISRLWTAAIIALPWLILRAAHGLQTDVTAGNVLSRIVERLAHPAAVVETIARYPIGKPFFWLGVVIAVIVVWRELVRRERFAMTTVVAQFGFYIAAYLASPHELDWHLKWSWDRLVSHLTPLLAALLLLNMLPLVRRRAAAA